MNDTKNGTPPPKRILIMVNFERIGIPGQRLEIPWLDRYLSGNNIRTLRIFRNSSFASNPSTQENKRE
jgi:hypothetical protein